MDTRKRTPKKTSPYNNYDPNIGEDLIKEANRIGNPCAFIRAKYGLNNKLFSAWLGNDNDGIYKQDHFCDCYERFKCLRTDFLDKNLMTGKLNRDAYACLHWSQLAQKVNPPKEITCDADVKTTMKVEDLNTIIEKLEGKKNSTGF